MKLRKSSARDAWGPGKHRKAAQSKFNEWIRIKDADIHGMCVCCTCGKSYRWDSAKSLGMAGMDAGHWRPGQSVSLLEVNCHPQCVKCNHHLSGNLPEYDKFMLRTYGQRVMDMITRLSKKQANNDRDYLRLVEYQCQLAIKHALAKLR